MRLPIKKSIALLAVLAVEGACTRAELATLLWDTLDDEAARRNLRRELHRLREAGLHDALASSDDQVALARHVGNDAGEFTAALARDDPPCRLLFDWLARNFAPSEHTEVEVVFEPTASGTRVTVTHSGWAALRPDHPARHGKVGAEHSREVGLWWGALPVAWRLHCTRN